MQTSPVGTFPTTLRGAFPKIMKDEGINGFYKSLVPLWCRQIPYTMMKFACFERTVEAIYQYVVPKPRAECSKSEQLVVTFAAGYIAGVFCAIVSHPADTIVSYMNKAQGSGIGDAAKALGFKVFNYWCFYLFFHISNFRVWVIISNKIVRNELTFWARFRL